MTDDTYIRKLHAAYVRLTGRPLPLEMSMIFRWEVWSAKGWTEDDLETVIRYIQRLIKDGRRFPESLRLYNLLDPDKFVEDLAEVRARSRIKREDPGRASVLRATGRPESNTGVDPQKAGAVLNRMNFAKRLKEWREANLT